MTHGFPYPYGLWVHSWVTLYPYPHANTRMAHGLSHPYGLRVNPWVNPYPRVVHPWVRVIRRPYPYGYGLGLGPPQIRGYGYGLPTGTPVFSLIMDATGKAIEV